jgi:hypothetical protein
MDYAISYHCLKNLESFFQIMSIFEQFDTIFTHKHQLYKNKIKYTAIPIKTNRFSIGTDTIYSIINFLKQWYYEI